MIFTDHINSIATVGVLVALLAIAFDPFAQQLVQTRVVVQYEEDLLVWLPIARRVSAGRVFWRQVSLPYGMWSKMLTSLI